MEERCDWCGNDPLYQQYHDQEWGVPQVDDRVQFEFLILESAQAGLSWITVLKKRDGYRKAFANFDPRKVARFDEDKVEELMQNPGIVRNRKKIESAIGNAKLFLELQREFGSFSRYLWSFYDFKPKQNNWASLKEVPATSAESDAISKDMKKRGFRFFGSTICYAHLQATGLVNDHIKGCHRHQACASMADEIGAHWRSQGR
ncbi:DNA-3-methyladenine glycosylase I [Spongiibacter taiwanensis]|uniref:DNA-3-methyladenine glycosylase I n=1 Tax=Spongiibacter taiwanensis TaxID=1748242 RepID=UPI002035B6C9|nr:DNA-3-methyladenine glycosylase I [Spongiibacter taiwanensis]USA42482.1 DNA-3-methyladenine glycosylase I [Spongiibacter taiwanensis]